MALKKKRRYSKNCVYCGSEDINYNLNTINKKDIIFEEKIYSCQNCGKYFRDKDRLGPSFSNGPLIIIGNGTRKIIKWLIMIAFVVIVLHYYHLKSLKNENGTYYPYSIVGDVETTKEIFQVGEELYCDKKALTVNSVKYSNSVDNKVPTTGNKFIILNVTIRNLNAGLQNYGSSDFELATSNGEIIKNQISSSKELSSESFSSGETKTGNVIFEIPKEEYNAVLNYYCDYWIFELKAKVDVSKK